MAKREKVSVIVQDASDLSARNLGPLVLVNPMLERMQIRQIVDRHCPPDPRLEIPIGDVVHALVANRICSPEPLLHVADWAEDSGAEFLLGTPASALNDDRLARALDAVFPVRWNILADVALHAAKRFKISLSKLHYDPTSFHFTGEYDHQSPSPSLLPHLTPFKIEYGRKSRFGPNVKEAQVGVDLANDGKGPVPIFYHSADGSDNSHIAVAKNLQHLLTYLKPKRLLMIHDRGCFSEEHAVSIVRDHRFDFISSVTWSDDLAQLYLEKKPPMREASFLSLKEKNKRRLGKPKDTWERYFIGEVPYAFSHENRSIRARLLFVHSTADEKTSRNTRKKYTKRIKDEMAAIQRSVEGGFSRTVKQVHKRILTLYGAKRAQHYFSYQVMKLTPEQIASLPPRRPGQRTRTLDFSFQYHPQIAERDALCDGIYAIATSLPKKDFSTDQIFTAFKEQHHIETAHHQWKAPIRLRPLFLKKPARIESLLLVQFLALMAFYLLQRLYRLSNGPSCRTTSETLIRRFVLAPISIRDYDDLLLVSPLKPPHSSQQEILRSLRFPSLQDQILPSASRLSPIS
jgi:transposase